ncbi:MAG TPA: SulP family inorganic anion transporter [Buttiauxella sp.]|uniref:SulP family inorganic anion transporter n=1 Tax=Buttiauxella sp. TaxID=1972222 RepID=UPI002B47923F|nr:SulP family inorganic anion transporter [Buttiauxella sp.]HKM95476.1 SulP family inorganic anion transporter [Buttiauxella sp.]
MNAQFGHRIAMLLPEWLRRYQAAWLQPDLLAGATAAAVVLPKALAYATVAGLPVQAGLYTCFIPMLIYAFVGSSRPLSVSTTTTLAILAGAALQPFASADAGTLAMASATLAFLVGIILLLAGVLRLGFVANFISEPVLIGFKAGIGVVIVLDQLPKLMGTHIDKGSFGHNVLATLASVPHASMLTVLVTICMLVILLGMERWAPRWPAPLIAVAAAILATKLLHLDQHGVSIVGIVPIGLPPVLLPDWHLFADLWPAATGIALMSFTESIAAGRAFAGADEPVPRPDLELYAVGLANMGGALLGAMAAGGGTSQTAVNRLAGARSQLAGLITSLLALVTMLVLAPLIGLMPHATLAAVVIVYSVGLIKPAEFIDILKVRRTEFVWALVSMAGVILLGTLQGIVAAIIVSCVALAWQVSNPPVHVLGRKPGTNVFRQRTDEHPEDETFPGLLLLRLEGRMFFANAEHIRLKIKSLVLQSQAKVVILDLGAVFDLEYTALKMLIEAERHLSQLGITLLLVGLNPGVFTVVMQSELGATLGRERLLFNLEQAVKRYAAQTIDAGGCP